MQLWAGKETVDVFGERLKARMEAGTKMEDIRPFRENSGQSGASD